jgi:hypothetical protein
MSFLSGFITAGFFSVLTIGAMVAGFFFQISGLHWRLAANLFSSACIPTQTSDYSWWRAQLHHGHHQPVCIDLQPVR